MVKGFLYSSTWPLIKKNISYISLYDGMLVKKKDRFDVMDIVDNSLVGINDCIRMKINMI